MSNEFVMDMPEDVASGGGNFLTKPGAFHFIVTDIRAGQMHNGDMLDGFSVELQARSGEETGKSVNVNLRNGQLTHKDGGEMCRKKQAAFLIAANVIQPSQLGQRGVKIDLDVARGQQMCAELELGDPDAKGRRWLDVRFSNMYHVDDPRAANIQKCDEELSLIPSNLRHPPEFFESLVAKKAKPKPASEDDFAGL